MFWIFKPKQPEPILPRRLLKMVIGTQNRYITAVGLILWSYHPTEPLDALFCIFWRSPVLIVRYIIRLHDNPRAERALSACVHAFPSLTPLISFHNITLRPTTPPSLHLWNTWQDLKRGFNAGTRVRPPPPYHRQSASSTRNSTSTAAATVPSPSSPDAFADLWVLASTPPPIATDEPNVGHNDFETDTRRVRSKEWRQSPAVETFGWCLFAAGVGVFLDGVVGSVVG
ncbi:hypothetical protein H0H81_003857 [Sphagnurus paluster]|uniref:Uncharacterized protein n=1 Tax=Sphagnurus paluster TaxID=117069 RepID=A0A9P7FNN1_9AGAR|nr:hypothetical protein H0H81_003857 [Sphagnurus paluster]